MIDNHRTNLFCYWMVSE